eukprot:tig00020746_g13650.t1
MAEDYYRAGCTACTAVIHGDRLYVANTGDSRAVLVRDQSAVALTRDQSAESEARRIHASGGQIRPGLHGGILRVEGRLAMARAIGDGELKARGVIAEPEEQAVSLSRGDRFLIVASDGLWDAVSNEEAGSVVSSTRSTSEAAVELVALANRRGSDDDITAIVVDLRAYIRHGPPTPPPAPAAPGPHV